jgi:Protein of unknown function (DUF998)
MPLPEPGTPQQGPSAGLSLAAPCLSLVSSVVALASLASLHILSPEFDPSLRVVSEYALGRYPWVLAIVFFAWAVGSWALGFALRRELQTVAGKIGRALLVLAGFGEAMAALFDLRQPLLHNLAAALSIPELPIAAILITAALVRLPAWSSTRELLWWTANLPWIGFLPMAVAMFSLTRKTGHPILCIGWPNRLLIVFYLAWTSAVAWHAIRVDNLAMRGSA